MRLVELEVVNIRKEMVLDEVLSISIFLLNKKLA